MPRTTGKKRKYPYKRKAPTKRRKTVRRYTRRKRDPMIISGRGRK